MPYASRLYHYTNAVTEPPALGEIRLNSSTLSSATLIWISHQTADVPPVNIATVIAGIVAGDGIGLRDATDPACYANYDVTASPVAKTGYSEIPVVWRVGGDAVRNNRTVDVQLVTASQYTGAAYATVEQLAAALRVQVSAKNSEWLQLCLDAAASEIDQVLDRPADDPMPSPTPALATTANVARAIEWYKANDAAFGAIGFADIGVLAAPADPFARTAAILTPLKVRFGIA